MYVVLINDETKIDYTKAMIDGKAEVEIKQRPWLTKHRKKGKLHSKKKEKNRQRRYKAKAKKL